MKGRGGGPPNQPPYQPDSEYFSIPRPPDWDPPSIGPVGRWDAREPPPFLGIKPLLLKPPALFNGAHDDICRFLRDCNNYFDMFWHYFQGLPSMMVVFASSHFEGRAQSWWTHQQEKYWSDNPCDLEPPRYRYPSWATFVELVREQFRDLAIEEVHEKQMMELKMGS